MTAQTASARKNAPEIKETTTRSDVAVLIACFFIALTVNLICLFWANRNGFLLIPLTYLALGALVIKKGV
ncbi:MAG: hypothetical protein KC466_04335 [Myxococcales bacterium]|nr:hypothetical protein [Myxococcales bacterium]